MMNTPPLFQFGLIADVQYVDMDNGWDFHRTQERHYRHSRNAMIAAVDDFVSHDVDFVLQLGDLLDGQNKNRNPEQTLKDLFSDWRAYKKPVLHCVGNHELYCFTKSESAKLFNLNHWYYAHHPCPGWKVLVLDAYAFSTLNEDTQEDAFVYLEQRNPNNVRSNSDWLEGLVGIERRFVPFNGALGSEQLEWLRRELDFDGRVVIAIHVPVEEGTASPTCLLWDHTDVNRIIQEGKASVVAVFAGHDHNGGYKVVQSSNEASVKLTHHITMQSPMVAPNVGHQWAHGVVSVYEDHLHMKGFGSVPTMVMPFHEK